MRAKQRKHFQELRGSHVTPALERAGQKRFQPIELEPILGDESPKCGGVAGRDGGNRPLHPGDIRGAIQLPPFAEKDPVLRVEPNQFDLLPKFGIPGLEDLFQSARVKEKSGTKVEFESVRLIGGSAPTDSVEALY